MCERFTPNACIDESCPNAQYEAADNRFGAGIADDMGLKKVSCKKCEYKTGTCDDCMFQFSKDCPKENDTVNKDIRKE